MNLFKNSELTYEGNKSIITAGQIRELLKTDFIGSDVFINIYKTYDGVSFLKGAMMFRSKYFEVAKGDWDKIEVGFILRFANILELKRIQNNENPELFLLTRSHIPIADDGFGNIIWIDSHTGNIKIYYHEYELDEGLKLIAPNLEEFCNSLENFTM